jgi:hypothetical protein
VLSPVLDPFHRPPDVAREMTSQRFFGEDVAFESESAAHVRANHPQLVLREPHNIGHPAAHQVWRLSRGPQRDIAVGVERRQSRPPFQWDCGMTVGMKALAQYEGGATKGAFDIARAAGNPHHDVVAEFLVNQRAPRSHSCLGISHCWQLLVIDPDQLRRILGQVAAVCDHGRDRLAHVAHLTKCKTRPFALLED